MALSTPSFTAVTSEGGLFPVDFLEQLLADRSRKDLTPESYHLPPDEKLNEAVSRSWNRLQGRWAAFRKAIDAKTEGAPTTEETRQLWMLIVFHELGYGRLQSSRAEMIDGKSYPLSHRWESVPIHIVGSHLSLDTRTRGAAGAASGSPHALLQQFLNARDDMLWGMVTNGLLLRLLRDNVAMTRQAYVEFDLEAIFEGEIYPEFFLFWLLCHQSRFEIQPGEAPSRCQAEQWRNDADTLGQRALNQLRPGVEAAISALGASLIAHPANAVLREQLASGDLDKQELYRQALRIIYRMLFLLVAEERDLLHPPDAAPEAVRRYHDYYCLRRLRSVAGRPGTTHTDLWQVFQLISRKLGHDAGCPELGLPGLGSFLWSERATAALNDCSIENAAFLQAIRALTTIQDAGVRRFVDYRNLGAEELGSVYEGLLSLHPEINPVTRTFALGTASGNERKTSGSYYTPDSLVQCLLDSALEPVIDQAVKGKSGEEAAEAILQLKVCDPAVGSGHFLIGAAHRMAKRVAAARTGDDQPSPAATRAALRQVIGRCMYGVDVNPMAVELCKFTLWLEATEPGKPLSFLDHHIRVGNSLLGTTPDLIATGLPDETFDEIEGDESRRIDGRRRLSAAAELKKLNKRERSGFGNLFTVEDTAIQQSLQDAAAAIEALPDETPEHIRRKADAFARAEVDADFQRRKLVADAWCAAFVIPKTFKPDSDEPRGITQRHLNELAQGYPLPADLTTEISRLSVRYGFFHWHLAFPEVFANGGFDAILGNPPWDKIQPEEEKFFSETRPDIAKASSAKLRKALIEALPIDDPHTHRLWAEYKRRIDGTCHYLRSSGILRFTGDGNLNSYRVFTELTAKFVGPSGRAGLVAQTGLATDESGKELFDHLLSSGRLSRFLDFENREAFFPDIDSRMRFCLVTVQGSEAAVSGNGAEFGWLLRRLDELVEPGRLVRLNAADLLLFNPSSRTCPVFTSTNDVEVSRRIYKRGQHVMLDENRRFERVDFLGELFNMTRDSVLFLKEPPEVSLPLYEAKFIHQFDHRFATTSGGDVSDLSDAQKRDPERSIVPKNYVQAKVVRERTIKRGISTNWLCGFRSIASPTNERTSIVAVFPFSAVGNSINLILGLTAPQALVLMANANSFVFDFCARQKISGSNVNIWIFKQLPGLSPATYAEPCAWAGQPAVTLRDWLLPRMLELTYTAWDLEPFARDSGWFGPPFVWDEARRFQLRCELDAAFLHLYGLSRADAAYILDTFPIVRRKDEAAHGIYRTKDTILAIYDQLAEAESTGVPFISPLIPPPATLAAAHPWSWRDLPMELPEEGREPLPLAYQYVVTVMTEMVLQAGGALPWSTFCTATDLLTDRKQLARLAEPHFDRAADWLACKGDTFDATQRFDQLSGLCYAGRMRVTNQDGELVVELLNLDQHLYFPHVRFDARLALAVAQDLAATSLDANAEQELRQVASLVPG